MGKFLRQGYVRRLEWEHSRGEISYSKMVKLIEQECIKNIIELLTFTLSNSKKTIESVEELMKAVNDYENEVSNLPVHITVHQTMKTIAQQLNVKDFPFIIKNKDGNEIYYEDSYGFWEKREYDSNNNQLYYEDSNGYWAKGMNLMPKVIKYTTKIQRERCMTTDLKKKS